jgi:hypothetical protein
VSANPFGSRVNDDVGAMLDWSNDISSLQGQLA